MESNVVTLNVGGTLFEVSMEVLRKCEYFASMFSDVPYGGSTIFLDRSPHIFKHVLSLLRDSGYPYPKKYVRELDYFLVNMHGVVLYDPLEAQKAIVRDTIKEELSRRASQQCSYIEPFYTMKEPFTSCDKC